MRARSTLLSILAIAAFSSTSRAVAPADQYETFSPESSIIVDQKTNLRWQRVVADTDVTFANASCPPSDAGVTLRLPTVKELQTLVDEVPTVDGSKYRYLDPNAFPAATSKVAKPYWTSTTLGQTTQRFVVDFSTGETRVIAPETTGFVRCVAGP